MDSVCKNHPDREAKRKCFYCHALVCSECQITIAHHIYCSKSCFFLELAEKTANLIKNLLLLIRKYASIFVTFFKNKNIFNHRNIIDALLIAGLLISLVIAVSNYRSLNRMDDREIEKSTTAVLPPSIESVAAHLDTLKIISPAPGAMIIKNRIDIEGETEDNRIVSLSANGKLMEAKIVKGRTFSFDNVLTKPGQNHFVVRSINEDGTSILLEEITFSYGTPLLSFLTRDFVRGNINEKNIALTFDGGYLDNATVEILDILKEENIKATMFLTGIFIRKYPNLVKRMAADGHIIGNHTWTHPHLTSFSQNRKHTTLANITSEVVQQEILRTAELFKTVTGKEMSKIWRAPYGEHNQEIRQWAAEVGYRHIGWTVGRNWDEGMDTMDWVADKNSPAYHSADEIVDKILSFGNNNKEGANGTIVLMHLGTERHDDYPHQKLPMVIDQLMKKGYQFVNILEML